MFKNHKLFLKVLFSVFIAWLMHIDVSMLMMALNYPDTVILALGSLMFGLVVPYCALRALDRVWGGKFFSFKKENTNEEKDEQN